GYLQPRLGAGIPYTVPRSTYRTSDGRWIAVSTSSEPVARRLLELVGIGGDPRFITSHDRADHRQEIDEAVAAWVGRHSAVEVLTVLVDADVAAAPVMDMADLAVDPHIEARETIVEVDGVPRQHVGTRLSK